MELKTFFTKILSSGFVTLLLLTAAWAGPDSFRLSVDSLLNGQELKSGRYELRPEGENKVTLVRNGKDMLTVAIERKPIGNRQSNSIARSKGQLTEIRLQDHVVIFGKTSQASP